MAIEAILKDPTNEKKYVLAVPEVVPYARQISADIKMPYGRDVANSYDKIWWAQVLTKGDAKSFLPVAKETGVTYIVLYNTVERNEEMYKYGYHMLAQTPSFDIYKYVE